MVAHLPVVAIPHSHNFSESRRGCTIDGESSQNLRVIGSSDPFSGEIFGRHAAVFLNCGMVKAAHAIHSGKPACWIPGSTCDTLRSCRQGADSQVETGAHLHAQAHISTQPPQPCQDSRLSRADEDQERRSRFEPPPCGRAQACLSQSRLSRLSRFPWIRFGRKGLQLLPFRPNRFPALV